MRNIKEIVILTYKILKNTKKGLSIYELQKKTKTSFLTMRNSLDLLKKLDVVCEKKDNSTKRKTRIFTLK
jgi:hypothetical protein